LTNITLTATAHRPKSIEPDPAPRSQQSATTIAVMTSWNAESDRQLFLAILAGSDIATPKWDNIKMAGRTKESMRYEDLYTERTNTRLHIVLVNASKS